MDQLAHAPGAMAELVVMASRDFQAFLFGQPDKACRFLGVQGERLFHIHMTSVQQALRANFKMALRRRGYMHNLRPRLLQQLGQIAEMPPDLESFAQLLCHQFFPIAHTDDFTAPDPLDLGRMRIRDFSAADDCSLKHGITFAGNFQSVPRARRRKRPSAPNPVEL